MNARLLSAALLASTVIMLSSDSPAQQKTAAPITVRPGTLALAIDELAGFEVNVPHARVVGVFNPRVLVVDTASSIRPLLGHRDRVLVMIESRVLKVPSTAIVGATVRISGVARTLLGVQTTAEVPWPDILQRELIERLEIRAAVMASSVRTAEGVELTSPNVTSD